MNICNEICLPHVLVCPGPSERVVSNNIFPNGVRHPRDLRISLHYPGQYFTNYYTGKRKWDVRDNKSKSYKMTFNLKNVNVIDHRNKIQKPCIEDWKRYDDYVMNDMMLETGCRPIHWNSTIELPICSNATQMKVFARDPMVAMIESLYPPCKSIDLLDYIYMEKDKDYNQ